MLCRAVCAVESSLCCVEQSVLCRARFVSGQCDVPQEFGDGCAAATAHVVISVALTDWDNHVTSIIT